MAAMFALLKYGAVLGLSCGMQGLHCSMQASLVVVSGAVSSRGTRGSL